VFEVLRFTFRTHAGDPILNADGKPQKKFMQRRPAPDEVDVWIWGIRAGEYMRKQPGRNWVPFDATKFETFPATKQRKTFGATPTIPYKLPELLAAIAANRTVLVAEGEKKVDALDALGFAATCSAGGAGSWTEDHTAFLHGADVVLMPDNDVTGSEHMQKVATSLWGVASQLRWLLLPGLPPKGDVVDWIGAGGSAEQLQELIDKALGSEGHVEGPHPLTQALDPPREFPIEALGPILGPAALAIHDKIQSPLAMCANSVLAAASLAVQALLDVYLPFGQIRPCSCWFLTIGRSSDRKTSTDEESLVPHREFEKQLRIAYETARQQWGIEKKAWDAAAQAIEKEFKAPGAAGSTAHKMGLARETRP
jgi:hypothetical protein